MAYPEIGKWEHSWRYGFAFVLRLPNGKLKRMAGTNTVQKYSRRPNVEQAQARLGGNIERRKWQ